MRNRAIGRQVFKRDVLAVMGQGLVLVFYTLSLSLMKIPTQSTCMDHSTRGWENLFEPPRACDEKVHPAVLSLAPATAQQRPNEQGRQKGTQEGKGSRGVVTSCRAGGRSSRAKDARTTHSAVLARPARAPPLAQRPNRRKKAFGDNMLPYASSGQLDLLRQQQADVCRGGAPQEAPALRRCVLA